MQQMQNPLAESEQIKAEAGLIKARSDAEIKLMQMQQDQKQFMVDMQAREAKREEDMALKLTEMELKAGKDLNSQVADNMLVFNPQTGGFE
jgi:hypothetical protein